MIGRPELAGHASRAGVPERTQEKDYVLAWLLAAVASSGGPFVFKGGTALRRCYFRGYRYSEDLDFTLTSPLDRAGVLAEIATWCEWIGDEVGIQARSLEKVGNRHLFVAFVGPLRSAIERELVVDATDDETLVEGAEDRPILSEYSDLPDERYQIPTYSLGEIWGEKVRSLMQRSEPRDLYDLAALLELEPGLAIDAFGTFVAKATAKGLNPNQLSERLDRREPVLRRMWKTRLAEQLPQLEPFDGVWRAVKRGLRQAHYL